ncbi:response regulator [Paucibacter sp. AS339]|uniref:LytR/AlgR family response regulator transcription factor n=1 Tax=Paucibacter hankyongi TaxID=3133434 RepID=UPI0030A97DDC
MKDLPPLTLLIVDDEPPARAKLRRLLSAMPDVRLIGEAGDADEAQALAESLRPDAALLDIQMPGRSGLELALTLPEGMLCAFCTAFDAHAVQAFELNAVDYLLKPYTPERLTACVQKIQERRRLLKQATAADNATAAGVAEAPPRFALLSALQQIQPVPGHWLVPQRSSAGGGLFKLPLAEVEWVAAADNYIELHAPPVSHLDRCTLSDFLAHANVKGLGFLRVHRSHAVNPLHIQSIAKLPRGEAELRMRSGISLRVSRGFRAALD